MSKSNFFPKRPEANPTIYAYELIGVSTHNGLLKIGYTDRDAKTRVSEQLQTSGVKYKIVLEESAMRNDGSTFTDHDVHRFLRKKKTRIKLRTFFGTLKCDLVRLLLHTSLQKKCAGKKY